VSKLDTWEGGTRLASGQIALARICAVLNHPTGGASSLTVNNKHQTPQIEIREDPRVVA